MVFDSRLCWYISLHGCLPVNTPKLHSLCLLLKIKSPAFSPGKNFFFFVAHCKWFVLATFIVPCKEISPTTCKQLKGRSEREREGLLNFSSYKPTCSDKEKILIENIWREKLFYYQEISPSCWFINLCANEKALPYPSFLDLLLSTDPIKLIVFKRSAIFPTTCPDIFQLGNHFFLPNH